MSPIDLTTAGDLPSTQPSDASCGPRALCSWSPPAREADTALKHRVDRLVLGNVIAVTTFVVVIGLLNLAPHLPLRAGLAAVGVAALVGGGWCSLNFWRCRHAHCLVTGPGWLALSAFVFAEVALGRSVIGGDEQLVFIVVLGLAIAFEAIWRLTSHTKAVASG